MNDIKSKEDIKKFVDIFYSKVKIDPFLGPVFIAILGNSGWNSHLEKMYSFWNTILFGQKDYSGNPFAKHSPLPIESRHFERWTKLLKQTIEANFEGPKSNEVLLRASKISQIFQAKMNLK